MAITHATVATGTDSGDQVSKNAWNADHVGSAGALVLLEQYTASASASLDFTSFISGTYDDYVIEGLAVAPATNGALLIARFGTGGGPTYDAGSNYYHSRIAMTSTPSSGATGAGPTTSIPIAGGISNAAAYGNINFTLHLKNPGDAALNRYLYGTHAYHDGAAAVIGQAGGLWANATDAATALRFLMSTGNIASGTIRVYGIAKT